MLKNTRKPGFLQSLIILMIVFFIGVGIAFNYILRQNLETNIINNLEKDGEIISLEIQSFFGRNGELVLQMSNNPQLTEFIYSTTPENFSVLSEKSHQIQDTLRQIYNSRSELSLVWMGIVAVNDVLTSEEGFTVSDDFIMTQRPWFEEMIRNGRRLTYTQPYIDTFTGKLTTSIVYPIYQEDKVVGNMGVDLHIDQLTSYLSSYQVGETGYPFILSGNRSLIFHPDTSFLADFQAGRVDNPEILALFDRMSQGEKGIRLVSRGGEPRYVAYRPIPSVPGWSIGTVLPLPEAHKQFLLFNSISLIIVLAGTTVLGLLFWTVRKSQDYRNLNHLYEQLQSSEEELLANYEEIQSYTHKIEHMAFHDQLTGLPNRANFQTQLQNAISQKASGAVILLDIDNFKGINDTLGHAFGDKVLQKISAKFSTLSGPDFLSPDLGGTSS